MRYNPKYFIYQDLIGVVLYGKSKFILSWQDFRKLGTVIDETKNTLLIQTNDSIKRYVKSQYIFQSWLPQPDGTNILLQFNGKKIIGTPDNRIKNVKKQRRKYH